MEPSREYSVDAIHETAREEESPCRPRLPTGKIWYIEMPTRVWECTNETNSTLAGADRPRAGLDRDRGSDASNAPLHSADVLQHVFWLASACSENQAGRQSDHEDDRRLRHRLGRHIRRQRTESADPALR